MRALVFKQGDINSHFLKVTFADGDTIIPITDGTATINASRIDGAARSFAGTVNEDGTVTVPITNWMLAIDDFVTADISAVGEDSRLTTSAIIIEVEPATNASGDVSPDDPNYDILVELIGEVQALADSIETDKTLSLLDRPADAQTVGNALAALKQPRVQNGILIFEGGASSGSIEEET